MVVHHRFRTLLSQFSSVLLIFEVDQQGSSIIGSVEFIFVRRFCMAVIVSCVHLFWIKYFFLYCTNFLIFSICSVMWLWNVLLCFLRGFLIFEMCEYAAFEMMSHVLFHVVLGFHLWILFNLFCLVIWFVISCLNFFHCFSVVFLVSYVLFILQYF